MVILIEGEAPEIGEKGTLEKEAIINPIVGKSSDLDKPYYAQLRDQELLEVIIKNGHVAYTSKDTAIKQNYKQTGRKCAQLKISDGTGAFYLASQCYEGERPNKLTFDYADDKQVNVIDKVLNGDITDIYQEHYANGEARRERGRKSPINRIPRSKSKTFIL